MTNLPARQTAIIITAAGGPDVLRVDHDWPLPTPGHDDVLIAVAAAGINRHDCNQRKAGPAHEPNPVPGLEVSGEIVRCGANVNPSRIGEQVIALTDGGGYAQYVTTRSELALPKPAGLDWVSAAALPEALFTTWFNFFELMQCAPGESALIHGGASGVGSIAIQLLTALGHPVYATAGTPAKREAAIRFGCRAAFDYSDPALATKVLESTGGRGVDLVLDMSAGRHIEQDLAMLAADGRMALLSAGGDTKLAVPLRRLMARRIRITGAFLRSLPEPRKIVTARHLHERVWPLLGQSIRPDIAATYPLSNVVEAHQQMEMAEHIGKIMLTMDDPS